jgi:hypothetical protein
MHWKLLLNQIKRMIKRLIILNLFKISFKNLKILFKLNLYNKKARLAFFKIILGEILKINYSLIKILTLMIKYLTGTQIKKKKFRKKEKIKKLNNK